MRICYATSENIAIVMMYCPTKIMFHAENVCVKFPEKLCILECPSRAEKAKKMLPILDLTNAMANDFLNPPPPLLRETPVAQKVFPCPFRTV